MQDLEPSLHDMRIVKIDIDKHPQLATKYRVQVGLRHQHEVPCAASSYLFISAAQRRTHSTNQLLPAPTGRR